MLKTNTPKKLTPLKNDPRLRRAILITIMRFPPKPLRYGDKKLCIMVPFMYDLCNVTMNAD